MISITELMELIETRAIDTYLGETDVMVDKKLGLVVVGQGERILVLTLEQAVNLCEVLLFKVGRY